MITGKDISLADLNGADFEAARAAVENVLVELRDARISLPFRGNGLVIRERDAEPSSMIRMGLEDALPIAIEAIIRRRNA